MYVYPQKGGSSATTYFDLNLHDLFGGGGGGGVNGLNRIQQKKTYCSKRICVISDYL